jgi:L-threonylcarbamoyladenylate synthase
MKIIDVKNNYKNVLRATAKTIKDGGLVVFPSDTVYGLLVDPTNQRAVDKLLKFKNRWTGKAISVAVVNKKMALEYVNLSENEQSIYSNLLPGPFTVISKGKHKMAKGIEAENGTLGIRIPDFKLITDLIKILKKPVTVTSANLSGRTTNYSISSFLKPLSLKKKNMIDLIVDAGKLKHNKPSTVIDATEAELKILRRGDLITGVTTQILISKSERETEKIAEFLLKKYLNKPVIFVLTGDLGTGKTVFSRKIGHLLGVKEKITSPTFVIYNEYSIKGKGYFLHFDLYRIKDDYELKEIKIFKLFRKNIVCIEWPENMGEENFKKLKEKNKVITVQFKYVDEKTREIKY